uniref:Nematode cuticle collagen N-terminal domain-containing protein n=1 Tax=Panagrolaimus sp. ES5 TaxID=591445 RepID=A0AC34FLX6_9BILA
MGGSDLEERRRYADQLRKITFFGVLLSTVATIASVIIVPLVYGYIQRIQSSLVTELELCRTESSRMWNEYTVTTQYMGLMAQQPRRFRRGYLPSRYETSSGSYGGDSSGYATVSHPASKNPYGGDVPVVNTRIPSVVGNRDRFQPRDYSGIEQSKCCACGMGEPGDAGPQGPPGDNGQDGTPGEDGSPGPDARPGDRPNEHSWCFDCMQAPAGPPGVPGVKGIRGLPGQPGDHGLDGRKGGPGPAGQPGRPGALGPPGQKGQRGAPGELKSVPAPPGPQGPVGPPGASGPKGRPGNDGKPGHPGRAGYPGEPGHPGLAGKDGPPGNQGTEGRPGNGNVCSHCAPPRLESGYNS